MGLSASFTNAPFDIVVAETSGSEKILTIASDDRKGLMRKADIIKEISEIVWVPAGMHNQQGVRPGRRSHKAQGTLGDKGKRGVHGCPEFRD